MKIESLLSHSLSLFTLFFPSCFWCFVFSYLFFSTICCEVAMTMTTCSPFGRFFSSTPEYRAVPWNPCCAFNLGIVAQGQRNLQQMISCPRHPQILQVQYNTTGTRTLSTCLEIAQMYLPVVTMLVVDPWAWSFKEFSILLRSCSFIAPTSSFLRNKYHDVRPQEKHAKKRGRRG